MVEIKSIKKLPYIGCIDESSDFQINKQYNCLKEYLDQKSSKNTKFHKWTKLIKAAFYFELGLTTQKMSLFKEALLYFIEADKIYSSLPKRTKLIKIDHAKLNYYLTHVYIQTGNYDKAKEQSDKAFKIFSELDDKEGLSQIYDVQSIIEMVNYNFRDSLQLAFKGLGIRSEMNSESLKLSYNNIGELFRTEGQYKNALEYYEKSKALYNNDSDLVSYAFVLNNIGVAYSKLNDYENAFENFSNSQDIFDLLDIFDPECKMDYTKAMIEALEKIPSYQFEHFIQKIENNLGEIPHHLSKTHSNRILIQYLLTIGDYYLKRNDLFLCQSYYIAGKEISDFNEYTSQSILIRAKLINRSLAVSKTGNFLFCIKDAQEWLKEAKSLAFRDLISPLIVELEFIEAVLSIANLNFEKASEILLKIKKYAKNTHNDQLLLRVELEFAKIIEYKEDSAITPKIDIVDYVSTIARYVRD